MRIEDEQGRTRGSEGHDAGRPEGIPAHPHPKFDSEHPGYETQDVNVGGIVYFLGGLMAFILVFFVFCFFMGRVINTQFAKSDGAPDRWHPYGETMNKARQNLTSNVEMQQALANQVNSFPTPRLMADDDNQETADMHAREDLLLDYYSRDTVNGQTTLRIPIDRAMELIAQRGLGASSTPAAAASKPMYGDKTYAVSAPLTNGFARTGFEQQTMETRAQKKEFEKAEGK